MIADFVPDELNGKIIAYGHPDPSRVSGYTATCDPAEDDDVEKTRDTSNLSFQITAKPYGGLPPILMLEYVDRPKKLVEFYQNMAYLLMWWRTKVHVELNKGGWRMLQWFQENYPELLALLPASYNSIKGGVKLAHGYRITPERWLQMKGLGDAYVENYWMYIPSVRLLDELKVVGAPGKDDDLAMAFLAGLMILQGDSVPAQNSAMTTSPRPQADFVKKNGVLQRIAPNITTPPPILESVRPQIIRRPPKSMIFKR